LSNKIVYISDKVTITGLSAEQRQVIAGMLTLSNPLYRTLQKLDKFLGATSENLCFYNENTEGSAVIPVGALPKILAIFDFDKTDIIDNRVEKELSENIVFNGKLRDYQQKVIDTLKTRSIGTVESPTSSGKSVIITNLITVKKQNTLILVNTIELMNQMVNNLIKFTNLKKDEIGLIGNGKWNVQPITVALLQTLSKMSDIRVKTLNSIFGMVVLDECHIAPAFTFYQIINRLKAKYKFGFSATPQRDDGLDDLIWFTVGPKVHRVELSDIKDKLVIPTIRKVESDYYFPLFSQDEYSEMVDDLCKDEARNNLIYNLVEEYKGKQMVILTTRVFHAMNMVEKLKEKGYAAEYLVSQIPHPDKPGKMKAMSKKRRNEIIEGLKSRKIEIVISTYSLFSTGIDISGLEILFLAGPTRSEIKLKQSIGRCMRKADFEKTPVIVDIRDNKVGLLKNQGYARNRTYKYLEVL
jgi:superfamily II DNA or RNA helicase